MYNKITSSYSPSNDFCNHTHEKSLIQKPDIIVHFVWAIMSLADHVWKSRSPTPSTCRGDVVYQYA